MIAVDSSAIVAILFGEPFAPELRTRLASEAERVTSVVSYVEAGTVLAGRRQGDRLRAIDDLNVLLDEAGISLAEVDAAQARTLNVPLLFIGNDFTSTDVIPALGGTAQ